MATTFITHVQAGTHAARPGAGTVPQGTLYACSTHGLMYQSDGSSTWSDWFDPTDATSSFGSNVNAVGQANAGGSSNSNTRSDHVHLGVRSVSHTSNTFSGPVTITNSGIIGITSPTPGTFNFSGAATGTGGGLNDQGAFTYLDATEAAAPSTPASGKVRIYAKSDGRIYSKDDGGVEYGPFSSGGGALTGERKPWDVAATYPLSADGSEFEYADLTAFNVDWTRRNVADADIFNPPGSATEFQFTAMGDAIYRTATFSANMWVVLEWSEGDNMDNLFGLLLVDTSGNGYGVGVYQSAVHNIAVTAWDFSAFGNQIALSGADYAQLVNGEHSWLGLERISSTQYRGAYSITGTAWDGRPAANTPTAFTPAYIAMIRTFSGGVTIWRRVHRINTYTTAFP